MLQERDMLKQMTSQWLSSRPRSAAEGVSLKSTSLSLLHDTLVSIKLPFTHCLPLNSSQISPSASVDLDLCLQV